MKTSIIIPVYNEIATIAEILRRVKQTVFDKEIIVVDDGSTDGTREYLESLKDTDIRVVLNESNQGKGAALRAGIKEVTGDVVVIQDADLEYYPDEIPQLTDKIEEEKADVVYGSRFIGAHRVFLFYHCLGNMFVNLIGNMLFNTNLSDLMTGYKAFRRDVLQSLMLTENGFAVEAEITGRVFKKGYRVYEVPISYDGRGYEEGKKIKWTDFFKILGCLFKVRISHVDIGADTLERTRRMRNYNNWLYDQMTPYLGKDVIEVGAGIGNFSIMFRGIPNLFVTEYDDYYISRLNNRFVGHPFVTVRKCDLMVRPSKQDIPEESFDTVVCSNVMEHIEDDKTVIDHLHAMLKPGGTLFLLVPSHPVLYGELDKALEHFKRYTKQELKELLAQKGFDVQKAYYFNPFAVPAWFMNGRILKRKIIPGFQSNLFDWMVPLLRIFAPQSSPFGISAITIAKKK